MTPRPFSLTSAKDQQLPAPKGTDGKPSDPRDQSYWPMTGGHVHPTWERLIIDQDGSVVLRGTIAVPDGI